MTIDLGMPTGRSRMVACLVLSTYPVIKVSFQHAGGRWWYRSRAVGVACDDGVMAQTREHLAILQLPVTRC